MQMHTIRGGGDLELHVRDWGPETAPALLLIHGWSQCHMSWVRQYESALTENHRIVALDNRGHGMSSAPTAPSAYADSSVWADDIAAIIDTLNLDRPVLAGWSYGGLIISDYVRKYGQDAIAGINYVGAATVLNEAAFGTLIGPGFTENFANATAQDLPTNIAAMLRFLGMCFEVPLSAVDFQTVLAYNMSVPAAVRLNLGSRSLDNTDVLEDLRIPVLVSQGRKDQVVLPASAEHIEKHCKTATMSWYDEVGHAPFLEDPKRYNRELADFARSCQL